MSKILLSAFHSRLHNTDDVRLVAASDLYKFMLAIHKLTEGKIVCGAAKYELDKTELYMTDTTGWPFCRLMSYQGYDKKGSSCRRYLLSILEGGGYSDVSRAASYASILTLLRKRGKKTSNFWSALTNRSMIGYVTSTIDAMATSYGGAEVNSAWRVRGTITTATVMWMMRVVKGEVLRTDTPPEEMSRELNVAVAMYDKVMTSCAPALNALERMASNTKWVICRLNNILGMPGYMVGAVDCRETFMLKRETLAVGMNASALAPKVIMPFTYYSTLNELPPSIKAEVMSQLHMMRINCEASYPNVQIASDGIPKHSQLSMPDAGWTMTEHGPTLCVMIDRTDEVTE
jgi:hypothetical protein